MQDVCSSFSSMAAAESGGWFGATFGALATGSAREQPPAPGAWFGLGGGGPDTGGGGGFGLGSWMPAVPGLPLPALPGLQFSAHGRESPPPAHPLRPFPPAPRSRPASLTAWPRARACARRLRACSRGAL